MSVLFVLVPLSIVMGAVAVAAFFWAMRQGQFDDLQSPAMELVLDSEDKPDDGHISAANASDGGDAKL